MLCYRCLATGGGSLRSMAVPPYLRASANRHTAPTVSYQLASTSLRRKQRRCVTSMALHEGIVEAQAEASGRAPRFYLPAPLPVPGQIVQLGADEARHASRALRLREGAVLELCDGEGALCLAKIATSGLRQAVSIEATEMPRLVPWGGVQWEVAVGCGGLKGSRADWLVEKCTELGARSLRPLLTERSSVVGFHKEPKKKQKKGDDEDEMEDAAGREARWGRVALAATKQSLRPHALQLRPATSLRAFQSIIAKSKLALVAAAGAPGLLVDSTLCERLLDVREGDTVLLIVGPEGDFTAAELEAMTAVGALPVGLGSNRLRVETAAVALLAAAGLFVDSRTS